MNTILQLDASNRIVLSRDLRRAAGLSPRQKLRVFTAPGRIVLEVEPQAQGKVVKRRGLKVWTGKVSATPLRDAVEHARHYER